MIGKNSPEKILIEVSRLEPEEFLGICRILGVKLMEGKEPRSFSFIWADVCDKVGDLNRIQRKNLMKLLRAANEDR